LLALAAVLAAGAVATAGTHVSKLFLPKTAEPGASAWAGGMHSGVRLLDGGATPDDPGRRLAGVEIRMDANFKTYWRTPGDSGLPPVFDWSGSRNLRSADVAWPAPHRFDDSAGSSIGYKERIVLPIRITPENPKEPVKLVLAMDYAVCEQVCIPARADLKLELPATPMTSPQSRPIQEALATVPVKAKLSEKAAPGIRSVKAVGDDRAVIVRAQVPDTRGLVDIFTEGPDGWTFSGPLATSTVPGPKGSRLVTYMVTVDSRPDGGKLQGLPLTLTMTAGDAAVEIETSLDGQAAPH
jgi:DsbC/DsbD-like thiol-disulfide interchange protein